MLIKEIRDNRRIIFDKGKFDHWCVYVEHTNRSRLAPLDTDYFVYFKQLAEAYGSKVYDDFVKIYDNTSCEINDEVISLIDKIVEEYDGVNMTLVELWFTVIYAGMVAEENKQYTRLGKRIKRLGMYQLLIEGQTVEYATNFSKGKKWRELDTIMKKNGF